jgi:hypothetical protein
VTLAGKIFMLPSGSTIVSGFVMGHGFRLKPDAEA